MAVEAPSSVGAASIPPPVPIFGGTGTPQTPAPPPPALVNSTAALGNGKGFQPRSEPAKPAPAPRRDDAVREEVRQRKAEREQIDPEEMRRNLEALNNSLAARSLDLRFGLYNDTNQLYVQVVSIARGEVLKTLPMEELLRLRETLETAMGLFLDETR
ncbi:MAG: flagellar protein FlaG [Planctomycetes bacterium]|nr:flagellar protein FlaG [Planctomycetota bacterium]